MGHLFSSSPVADSDQELSWFHFFYIVIWGNCFPLTCLLELVVESKDEFYVDFGSSRLRLRQS